MTGLRGRLGLGAAGALLLAGGVAVTAASLPGPVSPVTATATPTPSAPTPALAPTSPPASLPAPVATSAPTLATTPVPTAPPVAATPTPAPARVPVDVRLVADPAARFASEAQKNWCAPAAVQMVLAIRQRAETSVAFQAALAARVNEWSTWTDSHDGGWGPTAIASAIAAYGVGGYIVYTYQTRAGALRGAAQALSRTGSPVVLLVWRGAHAWVMNGYRADSDPLVFPDATVTGTYIMDPWYPRVSSIWGASDGPGVFQDAAEMARNFLPWARPEGPYPERDGRFIVVQPVLPSAPVGSPPAG